MSDSTREKELESALEDLMQFVADHEDATWAKPAIAKAKQTLRAPSERLYERQQQHLKLLLQLTEIEKQINAWCALNDGGPAVGGAVSTTIEALTKLHGLIALKAPK